MGHVHLPRRRLHGFQLVFRPVEPHRHLGDLVVEPDAGYLFLHEYGEPFHGNRLTDLVKKYIQAAGVNKPGACHIFRHTMATLMLDNGADIRFIQAMLGHADISTTQIYTHVDREYLRTVHKSYHPRA